MGVASSTAAAIDFRSTSSAAFSQDGSPLPAGSPDGILAACDADGAFSPTLDALSGKARALIAEMRAALDALPSSKAPPRRHDLWLKRFLAHGKWDVKKAMDLYLEMEAWRRESGADRILEDCQDGQLNEVLPVDLVGFYPYSFDKSGRIVAWMRVGHTPWWRALFEPIQETLRSQLWMGENTETAVARRAKETGVWRERAVILIDLRDLDFTYFQGLAGSGRARRRGAQMSVAKYYPGIVDKAYVMNAPGFANRAWSVLKYFLSESLMAKAVMVANATEAAKMLQDLGAENVPRDLGGTSDAPTLPIPAHLRMPPAGWSDLINKWRPREILIGTSAKHEETLSLPAGSRARWHWALLEHSIFFEVARRGLDGEFKIVSPSKEHTFMDLEDPVQGEISAPSGGGEVRLTWSNEHSSWRSKTLLLRVEVV